MNGKNFVMNGKKLSYPCHFGSIYMSNKQLSLLAQFS